MGVFEDGIYLTPWGFGSPYFQTNTHGSVLACVRVCVPIPTCLSSSDPHADTLYHLDIVSDIPPGSIYNYIYICIHADILFDILSGIYSDILHSIRHLFGHAIWHLFWHLFWHSIRHIFGHSIWHLFWQSFWHYLAFSLAWVRVQAPSTASCARDRAWV